MAIPQNSIRLSGVCKNEVTAFGRVANLLRASVNACFLSKEHKSLQKHAKVGPLRWPHILSITKKRRGAPKTQNFSPNVQIARLCRREEFPAGHTYPHRPKRLSR